MSSFPGFSRIDEIKRFMERCRANKNSKLVTTVVSTFSAYYVHLWSQFFPETPLSLPLPSFDGRAVMYPSVQNLRDYMSWRQADCLFPFFPTFSFPVCMMM